MINPTLKVVTKESEITLMTSTKRTAVCCLSSLNLEKYDEWKDTSIVEDLIRYLDNVLEYFIRLAPPELSKAIYSASKERAIGLGTLGFASYLQSKMVAFESQEAGMINYQIFKTIKDRAVEASKVLAKERGECSDCYGSGMRNSHLLAIAPNASSSSFVGCSPSIEPLASNAFVSEGRAGAYLYKNKWLEKLLSEKGKNDKTIWDLIISDNGSVRKLEFLTDEEKKVFVTFEEIDPRWIIEHAANRQPFICQAQSLNLKFGLNTTKQFMSDVHFLAWVKGVKTLYYSRAEKPQKSSTGSIKDNQPLNHVKVNIDFEECLSCSA